MITRRDATGRCPSIEVLLTTYPVVRVTMSSVKPVVGRTRDEERPIGALIPTPVDHRRRPAPVPAPMPTLPPLAVPTETRAEALMVQTARIDRAGRVSARHMLHALRWAPDHRVDITVVGGVLLVGSVATGGQLVGGRGELSLPAAACRMCGITPGSPVLLAASVPEGVLMVHPILAVARLLADWYARLEVGSGGG
jgi:hypothetical protein